MNMRESFEKEYPVPEWLIFIPADNSYAPEGDDFSWCDVWDYNQLFRCWQASRAAIVLPESTGGYIAGEYGNGYADALHEVKQAIGVDVP